MKKLLFGSVTVLLISCAIPSQGQITITLADFASIGDTVTNVYDTIVPVGTTVGGTGSQTWDYSNLQLDYIETINYVDPATTASAADFPASTLAIDNNGFAAYFYSDSAGVVIQGISADFFGTGTPLSLVYSPSYTLVEFPSTDGSGFTDTSAYDFQFSGATVGFPLDSIGVNHRSFLTSMFDAYGSLTTPSGTYQAIRQYIIEITYDSIMMRDAIITLDQWQLIDPAQLGAPNPAIDTVYNYRWYTTGEDYPVLEMETNGPAGNVLSANFKSDSLLVTGIELMEAGGHPLSIYPNPTSGTIYIDSYSKGLKVDVLDMMGRLVLQVDTENAGAIDLSGLPDGTYYVQIWKEGLLGTKKVVLIR